MPPMMSSIMVRLSSMPYERIDGCFERPTRSHIARGDDHQEPEETRKMTRSGSVKPTRAQHGTDHAARQQNEDPNVGPCTAVQPCVDENGDRTTSIIRPRLVPMARRN